MPLGTALHNYEAQFGFVFFCKWKHIDVQAEDDLQPHHNLQQAAFVFCPHLIYVWSLGWFDWQPQPSVTSHTIPRPLFQLLWSGWTGGNSNSWRLFQSACWLTRCITPVSPAGPLAAPIESSIIRLGGFSSSQHTRVAVFHIVPLFPAVFCRELGCESGRALGLDRVSRNLSSDQTIGPVVGIQVFVVLFFFVIRFFFQMNEDTAGSFDLRCVAITLLWVVVVFIFPFGLQNSIWCKQWDVPGREFLCSW